LSRRDPGANLLRLSRIPEALSREPMPEEAAADAAGNNEYKGYFEGEAAGTGAPVQAPGRTIAAPPARTGGPPAANRRMAADAGTDAAGRNSELRGPGAGGAMESQIRPAPEAPPGPPSQGGRVTAGRGPAWNLPAAADHGAIVIRPEAQPSAPPAENAPEGPQSPLPAAGAAATEPGARPGPAEPARRVSVEVLGPDSDRRVRLDVSERRGEVHVAVRSQDPELSESLRQELPGLVSRLEQSGYGTEPWPEGGANFQDRQRRGAPGESGADQQSERRSQPDWPEGNRPRRQHRSEESFAWQLRSIGTT
jgi:hypothetical protein